MEIGKKEGWTKNVIKFTYSRNTKVSIAHFNIFGVAEISPNKIAVSCSSKFQINFNLDNNSSPFLSRSASPLNKMSIISIDVDQVFCILKTVKVKSLTGPDNIPNRIMHDCAAAFAPSQCSLYNSTSCVKRGQSYSNF